MFGVPSVASAGLPLRRYVGINLDTMLSASEPPAPNPRLEPV